MSAMLPHGLDRRGADKLRYRARLVVQSGSLFQLLDPVLGLPHERSRRRHREREVSIPLIMSTEPDTLQPSSLPVQHLTVVGKQV